MIWIHNIVHWILHANGLFGTNLQKRLYSSFISSCSNSSEYLSTSSIVLNIGSSNKEYAFFIFSHVMYFFFFWYQSSIATIVVKFMTTLCGSEMNLPDNSDITYKNLMLFLSCTTTYFEESFTNSFSFIRFVLNNESILMSQHKLQLLTLIILMILKIKTIIIVLMIQNINVLYLLHSLNYLHIL